jgi:hypothetical protein
MADSCAVHSSVIKSRWYRGFYGKGWSFMCDRGNPWSDFEIMRRGMMCTDALPRSWELSVNRIESSLGRLSCLAQPRGGSLLSPLFSVICKQRGVFNKSKCLQKVTSRVANLTQLTHLVILVLRGCQEDSIRFI